MITFIGDTHGHWDVINDILRTIPEDHTVIHVGDSGLYPDAFLEECGLHYEDPIREILIIDGNHDFFPYFENLTGPTKLRKNLTYMPRGTVAEIDGINVGFCGGGQTIDQHRRVLGVD